MPVSHPKQPPHNIEAEQALLGAILVNNAAFHRVSNFLRPEHFAGEVNGRIFGALAKLIECGEIANRATLKKIVDQDQALEEIGGAQYLARLAASVVTIINAEDYGRQIHDLYLRRQLITIGEDTINNAYADDPERDVRAHIEATAQRLLDLTSMNANGGLAHITRAPEAATPIGGGKQQSDYWPAYLQLAEEAIAHFAITDDDQPKVGDINDQSEESLVGWFLSKDHPDRPVSQNLARTLATIVRRPDSRSGGALPRRRARRATSASNASSRPRK